MLVHRGVEVGVIRHVVDVTVDCRCPSSASRSRGSGGSPRATQTAFRASTCYVLLLRGRPLAAQHPRIEQFDPVAHRALRAVGEMRETADVGGRDDVRPSRFERLQLCGLELARKLRLQQRIGARPTRSTNANRPRAGARARAPAGSPRRARQAAGRAAASTAIGRRLSATRCPSRSWAQSVSIRRRSPRPCRGSGSRSCLRASAYSRSCCRRRP